MHEIGKQLSPIRTGALLKAFGVYTYNTYIEYKIQKYNTYIQYTTYNIQYCIQQYNIQTDKQTNRQINIHHTTIHHSP